MMRKAINSPRLREPDSTKPAPAQITIKPESLLRKPLIELAVVPTKVLSNPSAT